MTNEYFATTKKYNFKKNIIYSCKNFNQFGGNIEEKGILDPNGIYPNPLNGEMYSDSYKEIAKKWSQYPAYGKANEIIESIMNNDVILIIAETGSGKTVLIPKFALHTLNYIGNVVITLPKKVVTYSAAQFGAKTLDVNLGEHVGYQFKGKKEKSNKTKLLYATDGIVVAKALRDPYLKDFDIVIIDEAHERKVQIDFLLYLLKRALELRPTLKIIIMSATVDANIFKNYYDKFKFAIVDVPGRTFPVENIFIDVKPRDSISEGIKYVKNINTEGDIVLFVPRVNDAFKACDELRTENDLCIETYSGMDLKNEALLMAPNKKRRLIIATPVAESSMTIENVKIVIDTGYEMYASYDSKNNGKRLEMKLITEAQAKQRCGRTGRTAPGVCYHMYTKNDYENMKKYPEPQISNSSLYDIFLKLIIQVGTIKELLNILSQFVEPPKEDVIKTSLKILFALNLIDNEKTTKLGLSTLNINLDPMYAISIIYSKAYDCIDDVSKICFILDTIKLNLKDILPKKNIHKYYDESGDHMSILNLYKKHKIKRSIRKQVNHDSKKIIKKLENQENIIEIDDDIINLNKKERILYCLMMGHNVSTARQNNKSEYVTTFSNLSVRISRNSFLNFNNLNPKQVFYEELFISGNTKNINIVSRYPNIGKKYNL